MKKKIIITTLSVLVVVAATTVWVYLTSANDPVSRGLKKIYPAAFIGVGHVSVYDWEQNYKLAHQIDPTLSTNQISDQLISNIEKAQLVSSLKISTQTEDFKRELKYELTGKNDEYEKLLKTYFNNDEKLYQQYVALPQFYDAQLRIKYNLDTNSNYSAYVRAKDLLDQIKNGKKFEDAAKESSDDKFSGQLGGDLGFAAEGQLLPELLLAAQHSSARQVNPELTTSRDGYHILYLVETAEKDGVKLWHIKHILVATTGYENWLNNQLNRFLVWRIK